MKPKVLLEAHYTTPGDGVVKPRPSRIEAESAPEVLGKTRVRAGFSGKSMALA